MTPFWHFFDEEIHVFPRFYKVSSGFPLSSIHHTDQKDQFPSGFIRFSAKNRFFIFFSFSYFHQFSSKFQVFLRFYNVLRNLDFSWALQNDQNDQFSSGFRRFCDKLIFYIWFIFCFFTMFSHVFEVFWPPTSDPQVAPFPQKASFDQCFGPFPLVL